MEQNGSISFAGEVEHACEADGTEKEIGKADFNGNKLNVSVSPYSIRTYKVKLKRVHPIQNLQYTYLPLKYDRKCFSWNAFRKEADFESGNSYAAELLPDSILTTDGIPFRLGEKEIANGMTCKGDTIQLPTGQKFNRIYFLAASTNNDHKETFLIGNVSHQIDIPYYSGFIGQWGHMGHTEGFLKTADIAYVGTHRHSSEGDEAYEFTYMFKFGMDIPKGATRVILPKMGNVVILQQHLFMKTIHRLYRFLYYFAHH